MLNQPLSLRLLLAAAAGGLLPLAFAPFGYFWLAPLSLAALFALWQGVSPREGFWLGGAFGWASFLAGTHWVFFSIYEFGGTSVFLAGGLTLGMVAILGLYPALVGWLWARLFPQASAVAGLIVLPALWVLSEWVRGWFLSGFGWLSLGYSQIDSWLVGYVPVAGVLGAGFAVSLTAACLVHIALARLKGRLAAVALAASVWLGGFLFTGVSFTQPTGQPIQAALLQAAIPQSEKWLARQRRPTLDLYRNLTREQHGTELIVWPEAAIPVLYDRVIDYLDLVQADAKAAGSTVLLGILKDDPNGSFQNTLLALTESPQFYYKRKLVPFGEYFPVPKFVRNWMRLQSLPYTDAEAGSDGQLPLVVGDHRLGATICYEDAFGADQRHMNKSATLLVNVSNDAWFGDSIAPHQHLEISRIRAVEAGRFLLRATNTGITAVLDPWGKVVAIGPQFETTVVRATVTGFEGMTPYTRIGDWPLLVFAFVVLALTGARLRLKTNSRPN